MLLRVLISTLQCSALLVGAHLDARLCMCTHAFVCVCVCVRVCVRVGLCLHVRICVCMRARVHVHVIYVSVRMHARADVHAIVSCCMFCSLEHISHLTEGS